MAAPETVVTALHEERASGPKCGADMRIVAFITETAPVERILTHVGEPAQPPPIAPALPVGPGFHSNLEVRALGSF